MQDLCPLCAGQLSPGARKCRHCGEWLQGQGGGANPRDELAGTVNRFLLKAPKVIVIYVIVSVVLTAIGAVLMFNWFSGKSEQMQRDSQQGADEMQRNHQQRVDEMQRNYQQGVDEMQRDHQQRVDEMLRNHQQGVGETQPIN